MQMQLQKDDDGVEVVLLAGGATPARDTHMHSPVFFAMQQDEGGGEAASESDGPVAVVHVDEGVVGAGLAPEFAHPTGHQRREGRFAPGALGGARELLPLVIVTLPPPRRRIAWRWLSGGGCRGRG